MDDVCQFRIIRELSPLDAGQVWSVSPLEAPWSVVTLWPGLPPKVVLPAHPVIPERGMHGRIDRTLYWIEPRPSGVLLADLPKEIPALEMADVFLAITDALLALHHVGVAHGHLDDSRVGVGLDGAPILLGVGVCPGRPEEDVARLFEMWSKWVPAGPSLPSTDLVEFVAALKAWAETVQMGETTLPDRVASALVMASDDAQSVTLHTSIDEVGYDLGPDDKVRGLLDTWPDAEGEPTLTAVLEERTQRHVINPHIARLLAWLYRMPSSDRFSGGNGAASPELVALINGTPLDFLPAPNGVPVLEERTPAREVTEQLWLGEDTATVVQEAPSAPSAPRKARKAPSKKRKKRKRVSENVVILAVLLAIVSGAAAVWLLLQTL